MLNRVATFLALSVLLTGGAAAQTSRGSIEGLVLDATGAGVPGASIMLIHEPTGGHRSTTSREVGQFRVTALLPGRYRIEVEQAGYKKQVVELELQVGEEKHTALTLEIGPLTEEVRVEAPSPALNRVSPEVGVAIDQRQIASLPLDGRNFLELSLLVPGAAPAAPGSAGSVRGEFALNVNGAREDANAFLLDGVENIDPKLNSVAVRPPVDAIQEFEVLTSTYAAEFGRYGGGQINVILKSGTNETHGTAYEFFRNGALDARHVFALKNEPAPEYTRNQFGGSLGGPIARERTFYFVDYEGTRAREGITRVTNVPTAAERAGDFSASAFRAPINPFTGQPFPGNRIPDIFQHPGGRAIAALYPQPNRATPLANFVSSPTLRDRQDHADARVDHRTGGRLEIAGRYSFANRDLYEPFSGPGFAAVPGFGTNIDRQAHHAMGSATTALAAWVFNDFRASFSRVEFEAFHETQGRSINRSLGLPELSANARDHGLSFLTVSGFSPLGDEFNNPQESTTNALELSDTFSAVFGAHLLKVGIDRRRITQRAYRDVQSRGFLTFSDRGYTGNALADLLLGLPVVTGGARLDNPQNLFTSSLSIFAQDNYRRGPLTLNFGLRYERMSPPVDANDRATVYDPAARGLVPVGTAGMPRAGYERDGNNWAPRVGAAWAPGSGETVVRAAYGLYHSQSSLAPGEGLYFSAPYFIFSLYFPIPGLFTLSLSDPFPARFPFVVPQSALAFQRDLQMPYLHHWNATVQRQLGRSRLVELAYVGSRGEQLLAFRDLNQPAPSPAPLNLRPDPRFADISILESRGRSRFHSVQARFQQRSERGLSFLSSYTLSRSKDDASGVFTSAGDPNFPQDSNNPEAEYGRSNFDVRHRFTASVVWELPFDRAWQVSGIVTLQSGRPFTVALLPEIDNSNTGRASLGFGANDRPNRAGDATLDSPTADRWFNTGAFVVPPFGTFGNAGRNILEGPGYANVNVAMLRDVRLGPRARLQARVEAFNLFNRANYGLPDNFLGSPTFGRIVSADSPRRVQIGVKLLY